MPAPDLSTPGAPIWVDLFSSDTDKAEAFYGGLFGWAFESAGEEFGGYINISKDGQTVAGCMKNDGSHGTPDAWSLYLLTPDARKTEQLAADNGGQVYAPAMDVADLGVMTVLADAGGAAIGGWQQGEHQGFDVVGEAGTASWFELHTRDYEKSVEFYQNVFRWTTDAVSDTPEFRYTTLSPAASSDGEDSSLAGIMDASSFLPDGVPAAWTIYFGVEDADAAVQRIVELGGTVIEPAEDTPYGRMARVADTTGTPFKVVAPNDEMPAP